MTAIARTIPALAVLLVLALPARAQDAAVTASAETITTADRLTLAVTFTVAPGWTLGPWAAEARATLEGAGWAVVSIDADAPALSPDTPDALAHRARIVLEPFLPGDYAIPPLAAPALPVEGEPVTLTTPARTIEVASVLPENEPVRLPLPTDPDEPGQATDNADTPLGVLRPVPDEPERGPSVLALIGAGVALLGAGAAMVVAVRSARELHADKAPDPVRALRRLARAADPDLGAVDAQLRALARRPAAEGNAELAGLLARVERVRYAPPGAGETDPSGAIAADAAALAQQIDQATADDASDANAPGARDHTGREATA